MTPADYPNLRVLIVDDQRGIHDDFIEMLSSPRAAADPAAEWEEAFVGDAQANDKPFLPPFELLHADTGERACEIVARGQEWKQPIAVAYVDIRMPPGIDGIETVRRMRRIDRDVEVVIMTAYADQPLAEIVRDMESLHKLVYIRKPFVHEEIQQLTLSLAGKWNVERSLADQRGELAAGHRRLEAVLDATGDAIAMLDNDGAPVFANARYRSLLGLDGDELDAVSPAALAARGDARFRERDLGGLEERFMLHHGTVVERIGGDSPPKRLFYHSTAAVRDGDGQTIGTLIAYRDVSKEVEAELLKAEVLRLRSELEPTSSFAGLVGDSAGMRQVYALIRQAAEGDITVLIRGESGTGKELVARSFHRNSRRRDRTFVTIDCASIPESLIESELFGHERGAFTGAAKRHVGAFERAHGGTILLDEIGDMPLALQTRLLRVLQEREIRRVGGTDVVPVDIRVIASTNKDLETAVAAGTFREDLFYRISAFPVVVPPLRDRREDIPLLARHFLQRQADRAGTPVVGISTGAMRILLQHDWPGNVRELQNAVARAVLLETGPVLQAASLQPAVPSPDAAERTTTGQPAAVVPLVELERRAVAQAFDLEGRNVTRAAAVLGISRATLHRKLRTFGLAGR